MENLYYKCFLRYACVTATFISGKKYLKGLKGRIRVVFQCEIKRRSLFELPFCPYPSAMFFKCFFDDDKSNAKSLNFMGVILAIPI